MCRCISGRCNSESCSCFKGKERCIDCWCVLCSNRPPPVPSLPPPPLPILSAPEPVPQPSPMRNSTFLNQSFSRSQPPPLPPPRPAKTHTCNCNALMCRDRRCGCMKRDEYCGRYCGCELRTCKNQDPAGLAGPHMSQMSPLQIMDSLIQRSASRSNNILQSQQNTTLIIPNMQPPIPMVPLNHSLPINEISISTISPPPAVPQKKEEIPAKEESQTESIQKLPLPEPNPKTLDPFPPPKQGKCCDCARCSADCPCLRSGEVCEGCDPRCPNRDLKLGEIDIPTFIKI